MNKRTILLNCPVDLISSDNAIKAVGDAISGDMDYQIITINPEMIMNAQNNKSFLEIVNNSQLNIADGVGIKLALKFRGIKCENIRGVDFARKLIEYAAQNNLPVACVGAKDEVISKACENFKNQHPNLNIVYKRNGYFDNEDEILKEIIEANPKILLVGLGSPRQEEIISRLKGKLKGCVMIGVGGSFDVLSGLTKEAPLIYRKLGLEWLYRTISQPERIKRIFPTLPIFLLKCIMSK